MPSVAEAKALLGLPDDFERGARLVGVPSVALALLAVQTGRETPEGAAACYGLPWIDGQGIDWRQVRPEPSAPGVLLRVGMFALDAPEGGQPTIRLEQTGGVVDGRHDPAADVWAIRCNSWCLNRDGGWQVEPTISSRDEGFYARCRFTLEDALALAEGARSALDEAVARR